MKKTILILISFILIVLIGCKKEEIYPYEGTSQRHEYEYTVFGTSGSYNVEYQKWDGNPIYDSIIAVDSIYGNNFTVKWTYLGNQPRLLKVQAVSNYPYGWVTVEIKKDGVLLQRETKNCMDTALVQTIN